MEFQGLMSLLCDYLLCLPEYRPNINAPIRLIEYDIAKIKSSIIFTGLCDYVSSFW